MVMIVLRYPKAFKKVPNCSTHSIPEAAQCEPENQNPLPKKAQSPKLQALNLPPLKAVVATSESLNPAAANPQSLNPKAIKAAAKSEHPAEALVTAALREQAVPARWV